MKKRRRHKNSAFHSSNQPTKRKKMLRVANRDNWICHICKQPVHKSLFGIANHPLAPSMDHVIPRYKGGLDTVDNCKLSHRVCNALRDQHDQRERATTAKAVSKD